MRLVARITYSGWQSVRCSDHTLYEHYSLVITSGGLGCVSSPRHHNTVNVAWSSCRPALMGKSEFILVHTGFLCMNSDRRVLRESCSDLCSMCWRPTGVQRSAPLSSMGPLDMLQCLVQSGTALQCGVNSLQKVRTYKSVQVETSS